MNETERNRAIVNRFVDLFYRERKVREAFETCVSATQYIQHNPTLPDGREAAIAVMAPKFGAADIQLEVLRVIVDGPLACVHVRAANSQMPRGASVADLYRLEDGLIVEHWDILQPVPETAVSLHPMF